MSPHASTPAADQAARLRDAYAHCESIARRHYENFPVASLLLPRRLRPHVAAIYAFARLADDFADEATFEGRRLQLLSGWRERLDRAAAGDADEPVFVALSDTILRHGLPAALLHDLISAFEQDVRVNGYETFDELLAYCRLSANPVGRLVLALSRRGEAHLLEMSDAICTALQLTNFWQDVAVDLDKGRCYLPRSEMLRFGCTAEMLSAMAARRIVTEPFVELMAFQTRRTRQMFDLGQALPDQVGGRLGFELRLVLMGGRRVLDLLEASRFDVFTRRPTLSTPDWGRLVARAALRRR
ncbi:MAG: squalene synthase HpnC [Candidatus Polarisedimenticolia bacterium]